jgi:hypothetical protein
MWTEGEIHHAHNAALMIIVSNMTTSFDVYNITYIYQAKTNTKDTTSNKMCEQKVSFDMPLMLLLWSLHTSNMTASFDVVHIIGEG